MTEGVRSDHRLITQNIRCEIAGKAYYHVESQLACSPHWLPPLPLGAEVALPFAAYFFLSSMEDSLEPIIEEKPEPLLPLDVTDALDDCTGDLTLFHGVKWFFSTVGENGLAPVLTLSTGECILASLSTRSFSMCFFSSF